MVRTQSDLMTQSLLPRAAVESLAPDAVLLPAFAAADAPALWEAVQRIVARAPWRHMVTPGGLTMSVAMTNCGEVGWVSDRGGYRYSPIDPQSGQPWPAMPDRFRALALRAAELAGFGRFEPDACLINRYLPGSRLTAHQDRNENDLSAPVVSVSLGLPAVFFFGGLKRRDPAPRHLLRHGDVVVWGRQNRLAFHGVAKLADGEHAVTGACRVNLTFRQAR
jgi:alkylated DNA repair protein (DNA oxidative demethylase)